MTPKIHSRWVKKGYKSFVGKYNAYTVLYITNTENKHSNHPEQVVYQGDNGKIWSLSLTSWPGKLIEEPEGIVNAPLITDAQRIEAIIALAKSEESDFILEISSFEDTGDGEEEKEEVSSIEMFTFDTQWVSGNSVRELLNMLVK